MNNIAVLCTKFENGWELNGCHGWKRFREITDLTWVQDQYRRNTLCCYNHLHSVETRLIKVPTKYYYLPFRQILLKRHFALLILLFALKLVTCKYLLESLDNFQTANEQTWIQFTNAEYTLHVSNLCNVMITSLFISKNIFFISTNITNEYCHKFYTK